MPPAAADDDALRNDLLVADEVLADDVFIVELALLHRDQRSIADAAGSEDAELGATRRHFRVAPFQRACKDVVAMLPAGSVTAGSLSGVPLYNLGGNKGQAMLVAAGNACVVVTVARGADIG